MDYILAKNSPIATKWIANISFELLASNVINGVYLGHYLDFLIMTLTLNFQGQIWNLL